MIPIFQVGNLRLGDKRGGVDEKGSQSKFKFKFTPHPGPAQSTDSSTCSSLGRLWDLLELQPLEWNKGAAGDTLGLARSRDEPCGYCQESLSSPSPIWERYWQLLQPTKLTDCLFHCRRQLSEQPKSSSNHLGSAWPRWPDQIWSSSGWQALADLMTEAVRSVLPSQFLPHRSWGHGCPQP